MPDILSKTCNEIISLVETKEIGRNATDEPSSVSAMSSFRRNKGNKTNNTPDRSKQVVCPSCKKSFNAYRKGKNGWNAKAFKYCFNCHRNGRQSNSIKALDVEDDEEFLEQAHVSTIEASGIISLNTKIFDKKGLRKAKFSDHPRATFNLTPKGTRHSISISGIADTGAQSNLWGWSDFQQAGFCMEDLTKVSIKIRA
ncbi:MAG: hypothetical protein AAFO91_12865, partial [Bacteroidota bacterium]